jgi:hypothetical protein
MPCIQPVSPLWRNRPLPHDPPKRLRAARARVLVHDFDGDTHRLTVRRRSAIKSKSSGDVLDRELVPHPRSSVLIGEEVGFPHCLLTRYGPGPLNR